MKTFIPAAAVCAALLAGCGGGSAAPADRVADRGGPVTTIRIEGFEFDPSAATVVAGRRISVPNADAAPHTLTARAARAGTSPFDTGTLEGGRSGSFTAKAAGTYEVYCVIHPFMKGEVRVVA
jgi:plastocyanin